MERMDLSPLLKRIEPPTFNGDIKLYGQWKKDYYRIVLPNVGEDIYYLQKCLVGEPLDDVKHAQTFDKAISRLDEKYGDSWKLSILLHHEIVNFACIEEGDYDNLISFITLIENVWNIIQARGLDSNFDDIILIGKIERILPEQLRYKWYQSCKGRREDKFERLMEFLRIQRSIYESLVFSKQFELDSHCANKESASSVVEVKKGGRASFENVLDKIDELNTKIKNVNVNSMPKKEIFKPIRCPLHKCGGHSLVTCNIFLRLNRKSKLEVAKKFSLCFNCLVDHHPAHLCQKNEPCQKMVGNVLLHQL